MPKPQYTQKFRESWLKDVNFSKWLTVVESTQGSVSKCKLCGIQLQNKYSTLKLHGESKKHKDNEESFCGTSQKKIPFKKVSELKEQRAAEANLSLYVAYHTSINVIDHLSNICSKSFKGHTAADHMQLHRTKCSNIIRNVLGPHFVNLLRVDIGDSPYSLLIDESTDITIHKYLGIIIIYFSVEQNKIVQTFLDMPEIIECDAQSIVNVLLDTLTRHQLKVEKLRGLGTDNASVMVGINNGVFAKLKELVPNLVLVR